MGYLNEDGLETLVGKIKGQAIELTSAEYRQLPATKNTDNKLYFVTDEAYAYQIDDEPTSGSSGLVKSGGVYNWTSKIGSGTLTTTAQTLIPAVNEVNAAVGELNNGLMQIKSVTITFGAITAYGLETKTVDISSNPATFGQIVGWRLSNTTFLVPIQLYFSNANTIACRVTNFINNSIGAGALLDVYYI